MTVVWRKDSPLQDGVRSYITRSASGAYRFGCERLGQDGEWRAIPGPTPGGDDLTAAEFDRVCELHPDGVMQWGTASTEVPSEK